MYLFMAEKVRRVSFCGGISKACTVSLYIVYPLVASKGEAALYGIFHMINTFRFVVYLYLVEFVRHAPLRGSYHVSCRRTNITRLARLGRYRPTNRYLLSVAAEIRKMSRYRLDRNRHANQPTKNMPMTAQGFNINLFHAERPQNM